jgi:hypothetical protein
MWAQVYSFGVSLWEAVMQRRPHADWEDPRVLVAQFCDEALEPPVLAPVVLPPDAPPDEAAVLLVLKRLVEDCTHAEPDMCVGTQTGGQRWGGCRPATDLWLTRQTDRQTGAVMGWLQARNGFVVDQTDRQQRLRC